MKIKNDHTGKTFGRLTVLRYVKRENGHHYWECKCTCGGTKLVIANNLQRGLTQSCGCLHTESITKHGCSKLPGYSSWKAMHCRCGKQRGYKHIKICARWDSVKNFLHDMGPPPSTNHTIDRIDNSGNYTPKNCRWATKQQQQNNTKRNIHLTYRGETHTMAEWSSKMKWPRRIIQYRHKAGWSTKRIFETPVNKHKPAKSK